MAETTDKNTSKGNTAPSSAAKTLSETGKALDLFTAALKELSGLDFVNNPLSGLVSAFKKMYSEVLAVDTAMTALYRVTDETDAKYDSFLNRASSKAKELGRTVSSLVEQTAEWAKLGYGLDLSEKLAGVSSVYAAVTGVSDDTAVSDISASMKAFNIEASDAITIVDRLVALSSRYQVDSGDLGNSLADSASALASAGNSIDETLALITAMSGITQNTSEAGEALKDLSMRIRGYDEDTGTYTGSVDELSNKIASLTKTASTPDGISLFTDNTNETCKTTYRLLSEISLIWNELSAKNQTGILEALTESRYSEAFSSLISGMSQADAALGVSVNSYGSAYEKQEELMQSLEGKTNRFKSAFQSLSDTVLDSGLLKFFVDLGTTGISALDSLISKTGSLGTIGLTAGLISGVKNIGKCRISVRISKSFV